MKLKSLLLFILIFSSNFAQQKDLTWLDLMLSTYEIKTIGHLPHIESFEKFINPLTTFLAE